MGWALADHLRTDLVVDAPAHGLCPAPAPAGVTFARGDARDLRFDGGISLTDHDNIAFSMSTDGGRTWSAAIKVNQTPTTEPNYDQQAFTPAVHVADDGTVVLDFNQAYSPPCAFTDFAKKNFRLYFRGEYGATKLAYPVFAGFDRGLAPAPKRPTEADAEDRGPARRALRRGAGSHDPRRAGRGALRRHRGAGRAAGGQGRGERHRAGELLARLRVLTRGEMGAPQLDEALDHDRARDTLDRNAAYTLTAYLA